MSKARTIGISIDVFVVFFFFWLYEPPAAEATARLVLENVVALVLILGNLSLTKDWLVLGKAVSLLSDKESTFEEVNRNLPKETRAVLGRSAEVYEASRSSWYYVRMSILFALAFAFAHGAWMITAITQIIQAVTENRVTAFIRKNSNTLRERSEKISWENV